MRILLGCEKSGRVRDAFARRGHFAVSCDLQPSAAPGYHYTGNVLDILNDGWDMGIFFPPCTYLTITANRWYRPGLLPSKTGVLKGEEREAAREEAAAFFMKLANAPIKKIVLENPVGVMSTRWRRPDQIIQPYYFGHNHAKKTCLWLKNVPRLVWERDLFCEGYERGKPDYYVFPNGKRMDRAYMYGGVRKERQEMRSVTFENVAEAMALCWG